MQVGDLVELHSRFTDTWEDGFQIAEVVDDGYRVRRRSDRALLPGPTGAADVRPASSADWHQR